MVNPVLRAVVAAAVTAVNQKIANDAATAAAAANPTAVAAALANLQTIYDALAPVLADMLDALTNSIPAVTGVVTPGVAGTNPPSLALGASGQVVITVNGKLDSGGVAYAVTVNGNAIARNDAQHAVMAAAARITFNPALLN